MILGLLRAAWWQLRGVSPEDYHSICGRCGQPGEAHYSLRECWRFQAQPQRTWCWCPGCGLDLVGQEKALIDGSCGPEELVWYHCTLCGQHSVWNFNHIVPFVERSGPYLKVVE